MRIGFDLDGTVADLRAALAREARELFPEVDPAALPSSAAVNDGAAGPPAELPTQGAAAQALAPAASSLTPRQQRQLWDVVRSRVNFWETLEEIEPGVLRRLYELTQSRKWEVIFLTSRPESEGATAQMQSHRWLTAKGFAAPSVFVVSQARGRIAAALKLDVVVDDRAENCLDVAIESSARPILVWRGDEGRVPASARSLGIGAVTSVGECLDILEMSDVGGREIGIFERLRGLLGLKSRKPHAQPAGRFAAGA
jgi:hypothetical protein